ncbi:hypothetical protein R1158_01695 [Citrobacter koseri]|nr:hypothetical protein [Citrobacter koseri]WOI98905.1 hypothetical protein R1158_01695 [Citrobacter koseri]
MRVTSLDVHITQNGCRIRVARDVKTGCPTKYAAAVLSRSHVNIARQTDLRFSTADQRSRTVKAGVDITFVVEGVLCTGNNEAH